MWVHSYDCWMYVVECRASTTSLTLNASNKRLIANLTTAYDKISCLRHSTKFSSFHWSCSIKLLIRNVFSVSLLFSFKNIESGFWSIHYLDLPFSQNVKDSSWLNHKFSSLHFHGGDEMLRVEVEVNKIARWWQTWHQKRVDNSCLFVSFISMLIGDLRSLPTLSGDLSPLPWHL